LKAAHQNNLKIYKKKFNQKKLKFKETQFQCRSQTDLFKIIFEISTLKRFKNIKKI